MDMIVSEVLEKKPGETERRPFRDVEQMPDLEKFPLVEQMVMMEDYYSDDVEDTANSAAAVSSGKDIDMEESADRKDIIHDVEDMDPVDKKRARADAGGKKMVLSSDPYDYRGADEKEKERQERMQYYKESISGYDWEATEYHKLAKQDFDRDNKIFAQLTKTGEYINQHWHMVVCPVRGQDEDGDFLAFRFDPQLWNLYHYGEPNNTLPNTVQIHSLKLRISDYHHDNVVSEEDDYSLDVYGQVSLICIAHGAHESNVIFNRPRVKCQTLTKKHPYLRLTGPPLPPVAPPQANLCIEAKLFLKGRGTTTDDKYLRLSAKCQTNLVAGDERFVDNSDQYAMDPNKEYQDHVSNCCKASKPCVCRVDGTGEHYLLEVRRSIVTYSVLANIYVQLVDDMSPQIMNRTMYGRYRFTAYTDVSSTSEEERKVVLLDEECVEVRNNTFMLSRQTICVDHRSGTLILCIEHGDFGKEKDPIRLTFKPQIEGEGKEEKVNIGSCTVDVKVEWSIYWEKVEEICEGQ